MNKTLTIYIQQYFAAYITAVMTPDGRFNDNTPPITPEVFEQRLKEEALGPAFIHGTPTSPEDQRAIQAATTIYNFAYADMVNKPLNGDAPPAVVAWQAEARKGA